MAVLRNKKVLVVALVIAVMMLTLATAAPASALEDIYYGDGYWCEDQGDGIWFCFEQPTYRELIGSYSTTA